MIWIEVAPPSNSTRKMSTWSLCAATGIGVQAAAGSSGSMVKHSASIAIRTQAPTRSRPMWTIFLDLTLRAVDSKVSAIT